MEKNWNVGTVYLNDRTRIIVMGITGREASQVVAESEALYPGFIVAGVTPGKGGSEVAGKPVYNTVREALSRYLDGIIIRTDSHKKLEEFAKYADIPVINALTDMSHPCQILSDIFTLYEAFGEDIKNIKIAYVGDGNNVCNTWLVGAGLFGLNLFVATPEGYEPSSLYYQAGEDLCKITGGSIYLTTNPIEAVKEAHVVYTDVWVSMNQDRNEEKIQALMPYQVNSSLLSHARPEVKVMHCLPAKKGEEITEEVFEAHADFIFTQAENRLHAQKALFKFLFS